MPLKRLLLFSVLLLASCSSPGLRPGPGISQVEATALPPPDRSDLTSVDRPYFLGPFDELMVDVFGIPELSEKEIQIDASGRISFPLLGTVEASGKTPGELAHAIEEGLRGRFIRSPHVTVNLKKTVSQVITVEGEVEEPGLYPVVGHMTLLRAVATAKGTTEFSALSDVVVFRVVKGTTYAALYNIKAIRRGSYPDPELFANDIVTVGDSRGRRIFKDFLQIVPLLTTPIVVALQNRRNN